MKDQRREMAKDRVWVCFEENFVFVDEAELCIGHGDFVDAWQFREWVYFAPPTHLAKQRREVGSAVWEAAPATTFCRNLSRSASQKYKRSPIGKGQPIFVRQSIKKRS